MKIVFIGGRDIHIIGGIENYMLNLSTQLVKMGHEPIVFCEGNSTYEEEVNGFKVIHLAGPKSNIFCKPWVGLKATIYTIFKLKHVDFIHYNAWPPSLWSPLASIFGIKSLMQGHGLEWQRSKYSHKQQKIMKLMEWYTAHLNRNLIMCSEDQCRYFKEHYNREATTISTAICIPDEHKTLNYTILTKHSLQNKQYFLFLARLVQDKNPDYLIKAFNKIESKGYKLVIAGNNPSDAEYVKALHILGKHNPNVIFTGSVYGDDKEALLKNAMAFCIPSTIEGLSISLLEAMSYKLPIIASDIPSNREVLEQDKAIWVRPENVDDLATAFTTVINNPIEIAQSATYNYNKIINHYTWERVAEKYINHLSNLATK